jgi:sulfur-carrier protein
MPVVWIPSLLRDLTGGASKVAVEGGTVGEVIDHLEAAYPGIKACLCDGDRLRSNLSVVVDGEVIRRAQALRTRVSASSEVHIIPAISGG